MPLNVRRHPGLSRMALTGLLAVSLCAGCRTGKIYSPANLPHEFQAGMIADPQAMDLSKLAGPPIGADTVEYGDILEVSIAAALSSEGVVRLPVRVGDSGAVFLPEVGSVQVAGLNLAMAEQAVAAACAQRGLYRQPQVTVTLQQQRKNRITVVGAVNKPGVHELPRSASYLLTALMEAGGLAEDAGAKLEIRHPSGPSRLAQSSPEGVQLAGNVEAITPPGGVEMVSLNLTDAVRQGKGGQYLGDGSVVMIEKRRLTPVHVIGLVEKPCEIEFPVGRDLRVLSAVAQAGGIRQSLADKVYVIRSTPEGKEAVIEVSLNRAKHRLEENLRLQPGDVVSVEHNSGTVLVEAIRTIPFTLGASIPLF